MPPMQHPFAIRRLDAQDAATYRRLRLEALQTHPTAFGSSWEEESVRPVEWFAARLANQPMLGGWRGERLCGTAGIYLEQGRKTRHKGTIVGVFVHPEARGAGLGQALVRELIDYATGRLDTLLLTVEASNTAAYALYRKLGFESYGREPRALKIDGRYYDEILMALRMPAA
ncbi:N-acetyltransferase family protein [Bordetella petrii]|uniref:GNAT family N-acetyltransferase n=1 Tax=Bordetella petrii TaxID=94624 RepID=UPI0038B32FA9